MSFPDTALGRAARDITQGSTPLARAEAERDFYDLLSEQAAAKEQTEEVSNRLYRLEELAWNAERAIAAIKRDQARVSRLATHPESKGGADTRALQTKEAGHG